MTCSERDIFVTIYSNGIIEWRSCAIVEDEKGKTILNYELLYSGETQRQTHHCRISAAALCPVTQTTVALLYNSGNISIYQLVGRFFLFNLKFAGLKNVFLQKSPLPVFNLLKIMVNSYEIIAKKSEGIII